MTTRSQLRHHLNFAHELLKASSDRVDRLLATCDKWEGLYARSEARNDELEAKVEDLEAEAQALDLALAATDAYAKRQHHDTQELRAELEARNAELANLRGLLRLAASPAPRHVEAVRNYLARQLGVEE